MASPSESPECGDQTVPSGEDDVVRSIQSHYLRSPSPSNFSTVSESRFSIFSGSDAESIFMEPIHLSSAIAAKQIINEELKPRGVRTESVPESMLETAEQLMVEDLYNRVKDMIDDRSPYNTPCVMDIQRAMVQDHLQAPFNPVDEVWDNIFIGEKSVAVNKARLKRMGITHILNAAHGTGVYTGETFYSDMNICYMGLEVDDFPDADISPHFRPAAEFLDEALLTHRGKVLVNSMMGVSRSAVLVAAYLMIFHHMTIMEALTALRKKRAINPNEGFLKQLRQLNEALLEERDDDDDTLSQCSVIDALTRLDEEHSMMGVKAQSIMMEEEEDGASVMSSVASAAALLPSPTPGSSRVVGQEVLPGPTPGSSGVVGQEVLGGTEALMDKENEEEDDVGSMIREWQRRNEKYQNEEWWEAQLQSDGEEEEEGSLSGGRRAGQPIGEDLESVTSEEVRAMREKVKVRVGRRDCDSRSTSSCSSYSDLWKQRLKEIEEQAAARYRSNNNRGEGTNEEDRSLDEDVQSVMSDSSSMYNFCKRNKDNMTPLERWRVKRIQFGWNKKEGGAAGGGGEEGEREATPSLEDVNLTAYQSWKLKQQKRVGGDKEDVVELSRGEDSATVKRRQRREELLERSRKTLEESQSMCGWETESSLSGSTVPLSAFWAGAGVTNNDDNISMLSGRSSIMSQSRSVRSQPAGMPLTPVPIVPVPTMMGPGGEPMVNLASIQNWIANVVTDTLNQKQAEMSLPPSRAGSVLSFDGGSSLYSGHGATDDKASVLSGASYSSSLSNTHGPTRAASSLSGMGSRRNKITTTSVPLYSLFQDQVNLHKLDLMDKEIKSEMRDKMASYEVKKIAEDNKRSTLYKKKPKEEEKDEEEDQVFSPGKTSTISKGIRGDTSTPKKATRSYGLSGRLNLSTALEREKNTSIDEWLNSVRPPQRRQEAAGTEKDSPGFSRINEEEDEDEDFPSEYQFRRRADSDSSPDHSPEPLHPARRSMLDRTLKESTSYSRAGAPYDSLEEGDESQPEYSAKRKFTHYSQYRETQDGRGGEGDETRRRGGGAEEEEESDVAEFIRQTRQRSRAQAAAEVENDDVIASWRAQLDSRAHSRSEQDD